MSTAAVDQRLDAIVPVIAWNFADQPLQGRHHQVFVGQRAARRRHRPGNTFSPSILKGREQARKGTTFSSRWSISRLLQVLRRCADRHPTLILQGTIDDLFPPSEAIENHNALTRAGVPGEDGLFCGGHGVCLTKGGASKLPLEQTWTWLDKYLKGNTAADTGPGFTWIDQRGKYRSASSYPTPDRTLTAKEKGHWR